MLNTLISFLIDTSYEDLPPEIFHQAKRCIIDWTGVALAGAGHPTVSILIDTVQAMGGHRQAAIFGTAHKTSAINAALVNGTMSHVLDYDDTHLEALMHPSAPLVPALFAYGERNESDGKAFLLSYVLGFEIETRISMAMGEPHYDTGWHSTATMGRFGAAAGVGKLAGLSEDEMANAFGLAGTQASGIRNVFGTMTKSFHPGKAAADGLLSVLLAQRGFTSAGDILADGKGLGNIFSSDFTPRRGLHDLGVAYTLPGTSIKPFASCLYTHPTIDAVIRLKNDHGIRPDAVDRIRCGISKFCKDAANQKHPQTGLAAKFSVTFCAALALLEGSAGESLFQDANTGNAKILDIMQRVDVEEIPDQKDSEARVTIILRNGQRLEEHVQHPLGSPAHPLSDGQVEDKAKNLLTLAFDRKKAGIIIDKLWALEQVENISEIAGLLTKT